MGARVSEELAKMDGDSARYIKKLQDLTSESYGTPAAMAKAHALYRKEGWIDDAIEHLHKALDIDQPPGAADTRMVRQAIAKGYMLRGEYATALIYLSDALNLPGSSTSDLLALGIIGDIGTCHRGMGDLHEAIRSFERGRALAEPLEDKTSITFMLENLGVCYAQIGDLGRSFATLQRARELEKRSDGQAWAFDVLRSYYAQKGEVVRPTECYLVDAFVRNVRSIHEITWKIPAERAPGWHVILGANGSGKTSLLRSIALALIGSGEAPALRQDFGRWVRVGSETGQIDLTLSLPGLKPVYDVLSPTPEGEVLASAEMDDSGASRPRYPHLGIELRREGAQVRVEEREPAEEEKREPFDRTFLESCGGAFSAAYGPFRRMADADPDYERTVSAQPRVGRHISLFDSRVTLAESIPWLERLKADKLDGKPEGALLDPFIQLLNDPGPPSFLPHGARLVEASMTKMGIVDGEGAPVAFADLSDGHRAVLSLHFDLIRHMAAAFGISNVFSPESSVIVLASGIVLIDEIDVHLHPTWQQQIGVWFKRHFPNVQFIVTTHSPLVCQAADSIFVLPTPGTDGEARMLEGVELDRVRYGNVLEAYGTEVFGRGVTRSDDSRKMLRRLVELNRKELDQGLSDEERDEQQRLRAILPTAAPLVSTSKGGEA